ncbi:MAG: amino acid ABC transporter permease [Desulfobacterales bacterium]|nr:amino acid ABC transporter permease [Desulfobacterales bacterium]
MRFKLKGVKPFLICAVFFLILFTGYHNLEYNWQWYRVWAYLFTYENGVFTPGILLDGLMITIRISAISLVLSLFIGFLSAFARLSNYPSLRAISWLYVEIVRNTPLLIQIFVIYFVVSPVFNLSAFVSAVIALSLFEGAYSSEIIRSGIINVPKGQFEAAQSIGLTTAQSYLKVIIPQMLRQILPMLAGQSVSLIKDSALVSTISIYDLTMQGQRIVSETFLTFEIWFVVAICYLMITVSLSIVIRWFENHLNFINR